MRFNLTNTINKVVKIISGHSSYSRSSQVKKKYKIKKTFNVICHTLTFDMSWLKEMRKKSKRKKPTPTWSYRLKRDYKKMETILFWSFAGIMAITHLTALSANFPAFIIFYAVLRGKSYFVFCITLSPEVQHRNSVAT